MANQNRPTRRKFQINLSYSVDSDLIDWLETQESAQGAIRDALRAYMGHQPEQPDPLVKELKETIARAERLITTIRGAPIQSVECLPTQEQAVDPEFANTVRGNMRPAFKPKR